MKEIYLSKDGYKHIDYVSLVDDEDYEELNKYSWHVMGDKIKYAARHDGANYILLHREVTKANSDYIVDHINHNGLDNRKENLRLCNRYQNSQNRRKRNNTSSKYKGVSFDKERNKWVVAVSSEGNSKIFKRFNYEEEAAEYYNKYASLYHKEFAVLNDLDHIEIKRTPPYVYTSKYVGVNWRKDIEKWRAYINIGERQFILGVYINEDDAALAYNNKVHELGLNRKLNIIE